MIDFDKIKEWDGIGKALLGVLAIVGFWWLKVKGAWEVVTAIPQFVKDLVVAVRGFAEVAGSIKEVKSMLVSNGKIGLIDEVRMIKQIDTLAYERGDHAGFQRFGTGENFLVTRGYRRLLGLEDERFLLGHEWVNVLHPNDREEYLRGFEDAVKYHRDYNTIIKLVNPLTMEYRGEWHMIANRYPYGSRVIYIGQLVKAMDMTAKAIMDKHKIRGDIHADLIADDPTLPVTIHVEEDDER